MRVFLDTSAFAKLYLPEPDGDRLREWVEGAERRHVSSLGLAEMESALARLIRMGQLDAGQARRVRQRLDADVEDGFLEPVRVHDEDIRRAAFLMRGRPELAVRTLDGIQLSVAITLAPDRFGTADRRLAAAARTVGLRVVGPDDLRD